MKITAVRPWIIRCPAEGAGALSFQRAAPDRQYVFVQVETDEGLTGWGEITTYPGLVANRAACAMIREIEPSLVGDDPDRIEAMTMKLAGIFSYTGTRGAASALTSAIDIALWDIQGQALGVPVYRLLGGAVRETIPLYTHYGYAGTVEEFVESARDQIRQGAKALKTDPFFHEMRPKGPGYTDGQISPAGEQRGVDMIAAVREAVGPDIELLIDCHGLYDVPTAVRLAHRLAPYHITWFEEPVAPLSFRALAAVRGQIPTRICVGERLHSRWDFLPIFNEGLADYVMPDVTWTGGISELKKIATMAEVYGIPISPHDASGPVNILAGAHVGMTVPNFYRLEALRVTLDSYNVLLEEPLVTRDGNLIMPDRPGLGLTMNMDYFRAHAEPGWAG
jgi:galactonate dehydratase